MFKYFIRAQEKKAAIILKHKRLFAIIDMVKVGTALVKFGAQLEKVGFFDMLKEVWREQVVKLEEWIRAKDRRYRSWETEAPAEEPSTGTEEDD